MYSLKSIKYAIENPKNVLWELSSHYHRTLRGKRGIDLMSADWDNLIILDACRYDQFREVANLQGQLESVISKGSSTAEFLQRNFSGAYPDTVYVSANPQFQRFQLGNRFHASAKLWETDWDDQFGTIPPEATAKVGAEFADKYPRKRLIVHFLQPHYPFIGETGRNLDQRAPSGEEVVNIDEDKLSIWAQLQRGDISEDLVRQAYDENLKIALPAVNQLVNNLKGKTVITSDHGNAFGRYGVYGHPARRFLEELVKVPWYIPEYSERKEITKGQLDESEVATAEVQQRLEDLGYT